MSDASNVPDMPGSLRNRLGRAPAWFFVLYASGVAFATYFCMYGLRKPFDVVTFTGAKFLGIDLKTACVLGQIVGYMLSKYVGARLCAEVSRSRRALVLAGAGLWSELALLGFALGPEQGRPFAMFANGLPLGVVWGLIVRYLEGRRTSDVLLIGLSGSFIIAGAITKDVGLYLMSHSGTVEAWVPAAAGAIFLVPYLIFIWLLDQLPPPTVRDQQARTERPNLDSAGRSAFLRRFGPPFFLLLVAYFLLTAYRDFRDHYGREILQALGHPGHPGIFTANDRWALLATLIALGLINFAGNHRRALSIIGGVILAGFAIIAASTALFQSGRLAGIDWLAAVGVGLYLAYVPFGTVLFERVVAATRFAGTSVFAIQLADGVGYTGSVLIQLYRDLAHPHISRAEFMVPLSYAVAGIGAASAVLGGMGMRRRMQAPT